MAALAAMPPTREEEAAAMEAMKGTTLENYELLQQVGSGTFCVVRLCRFKKNGKIYVVKILKKKKICYLKQVVHVTQVISPFM